MVNTDSNKTYAQYKQRLWDENHDNVGASDNFVTSTSFSSLNKYHKLSFPTGKRILEIGGGYRYSR